jgi:antitoxin YefM
MDAVSFTEARGNLAELMRRVNEDHAPVMVTSQRGRPVVMMSLEDFNALEETAYLLRSPANAKRLARSVEQLRAGAGASHDLVVDAD